MRSRRGPLALAAALALSACGSDEPGAATASGSDTSSAVTEQIQVATSTDVYGALVTAVGGDRVEVTSFIDNPASDPEAYEATPADAAAVQAAQLVIGNGGGYDEFVFQLVEAAGGQRTVIDVTELSGLAAEVPEGEELNEHLWFELPTMQRLAERVAGDLGELSPDDAETFTANAAAFAAEVDGLSEDVAAIRADHEGERVAATEPLPLYLLAAAGLVNATPEEFMEASEEGADAPAAVVQETLEAVAGDDPVTVLLLNVQTQTAATDRLRAAAVEAGVTEVEVFETLSGQDYVPWLSAQIQALADALDA